MGNDHQHLGHPANNMNLPAMFSGDDFLTSPFFDFAPLLLPVTETNLPPPLPPPPTAPPPLLPDVVVPTHHPPFMPYTTIVIPTIVPMHFSLTPAAFIFEPHLWTQTFPTPQSPFNGLNSSFYPQTEMRSFQPDAAAAFEAAQLPVPSTNSGTKFSVSTHTRSELPSQNALQVFGSDWFIPSDPDWAATPELDSQQLMADSSVSPEYSVVQSSSSTNCDFRMTMGVLGSFAADDPPLHAHVQHTGGLRDVPVSSTVTPTPKQPLLEASAPPPAPPLLLPLRQQTTIPGKQRLAPRPETVEQPASSFMLPQTPDVILRRARKFKFTASVISKVDPDADGRYSCPICTTSHRGRRVFDTMSNLRAHVRLHHDKGRTLSCTECSKTFLRKQDLDRHTATHLPNEEKEHCCELCEMRFSRRDALISHVRRAHKQHEGRETSEQQQTDGREGLGGGQKVRSRGRAR
ncbi:hypothetical protein BJ742DRAFT_826078 [Cladochytrium replicatum]|nr:hypothetical protein BJ742DRAFT_826078 [Cladochytrium replicatum]